MYEELDRLILAAIERGRNPLYEGDATREAERLAALTGREPFRVTDGRLQALRRKKRILWLTKAEASGGLGGWKIAKADHPHHP